MKGAQVLVQCPQMQSMMRQCKHACGCGPPIAWSKFLKLHFQQF